jgi:hypothetical protein
MKELLKDLRDFSKLRLGRFRSFVNDRRLMLRVDAELGGDARGDGFGWTEEMFRHRKFLIMKKQLLSDRRLVEIAERHNIFVDELEDWEECEAYSQAPATYFYLKRKARIRIKRDIQDSRRGRVEMWMKLAPLITAAASAIGAWLGAYFAHH